MFLGPHEKPEGEMGIAPSQSIFSQDPLPSGPALAQKVRTVIGLRKEDLMRYSQEPFWQKIRNNCVAIALLKSLQKMHPENYLKLLHQLWDRGELRFRSDGNEVKIPANLTGDFDNIPTDREPYELLAATLMQGTQSALATMLADDLGEFAQKSSIELPANFQRTFQPKFQWNQKCGGLFLIKRKPFDEKLRALQLNQSQIDGFYDFIEEKYIESHANQLVHTLQRVRVGQPLEEGTTAFSAPEDCIVFHGAIVSPAYKILFGEEASRPFAVIDGRELRKHAQRKDYDHAPREILKALLKMKHERNLRAGTIVPAESVQYHAFTLQIPKFNTFAEIEEHLANGGSIVLGATNWRPDMNICAAYDKSGKMVMYYGSADGTLNRRHSMGRCFFYSSTGRDVRIYDPTKLKFDVVDSDTGDI
jgi:hypothetical protein